MEKKFSAYIGLDEKHVIDPAARVRIGDPKRYNWRVSYNVGPESEEPDKNWDKGPREILGGCL